MSREVIEATARAYFDELNPGAPRGAGELADGLMKRLDAALEASRQAYIDNAVRAIAKRRRLVISLLVLSFVVELVALTAAVPPAVRGGVGVAALCLALLSGSASAAPVVPHSPSCRQGDKS